MRRLSVVYTCSIAVAVCLLGSARAGAVSDSQASGSVRAPLVTTGGASYVFDLTMSRASGVTGSQRSLAELPTGGRLVEAIDPFGAAASVVDRFAELMGPAPRGDSVAVRHDGLGDYVRLVLANGFHAASPTDGGDAGHGAPPGEAVGLAGTIEPASSVARVVESSTVSLAAIGGALLLRVWRRRRAPKNRFFAPPPIG